MGQEYEIWGLIGLSVEVPEHTFDNVDMKTQRGSSLIELMVGITLLGIISIGFATLMSQMNKSQQITTARQDIVAITQEMQTMFSSPTICQSGLVPGTVFDLTQAQSAYPPPSGNPIAGLSFQYKLNSDTLKANSTLQNYSVNVNRILLVNAGTAGVDTTGNTIYRADIIAEFAPKQASVSFGIRPLTSGYFTTSGGNIATCSSIAPATQTVADANCTMLGGTYTAGTGGAAGSCDIPPSAATTCKVLGGTFSGGACALASSGGTQLTANSLCSILGGTINSGVCNLGSGNPGSASTGPATSGNWKKVADGCNAGQMYRRLSGSCSPFGMVQFVNGTGAFGPCSVTYQCL